MPASESDDRFPATRWSLVHAARGKDEPKARRALEELCATYWLPIYGYIRSRGNDAHDAEDLTQAFFESLIRRDSLAKPEEERGKLRAFLLGALKKFLVDAHRKESALKRGGEATILSFDWGRAEEAFVAGAWTTGEASFDHEWARLIVDQVMGKLRGALGSVEREAQFDALLPHLTAASGDPPYRKLAEALATNVPSLRVTMSRLRQRFRRALEHEISDTVASEEELREEIVYLLGAYEAAS